MASPADALLQGLITRIDQGVLPWRQPWSAGRSPSAPIRADGAPFSGANAWLLAFAGADRASPYWFTFKQALALGACVRKGERGQHVILYKTRSVETQEGDEEARQLRWLQVYVVFNAEQLNDCPSHFLGAPPVDEVVRASLRDTVIDAIPAETVFGGGRAYYDRASDRIHLPPPETFVSVDEARATHLHELAHWSGAANRLNREFGQRYGDEAYAFEELVAELSSALLGLHLRTPPQTFETHAQYLGAWAKLLSGRPNAILEASGHAQRCVDYLLAFSRTAAANSLAEAA